MQTCTRIAAFFGGAAATGTVVYYTSNYSSHYSPSATAAATTFTYLPTGIPLQSEGRTPGNEDSSGVDGDHSEVPLISVNIAVNITAIFTCTAVI